MFGHRLTDGQILLVALELTVIAYALAILAGVTLGRML